MYDKLTFLLQKADVLKRGLEKGYEAMQAVSNGLNVVRNHLNACLSYTCTHTHTHTHPVNFYYVLTCSPVCSGV